MRRYLQFKNWRTGELGDRVDVTGESDHNREKCLRGMLRNIGEDWLVTDIEEPHEPAESPPLRLEGE